MLELLALLRIADGLDVSHSGVISTLALEGASAKSLDNGERAETIALRAAARDDGSSSALRRKREPREHLRPPPPARRRPGGAEDTTARRRSPSLRPRRGRARAAPGGLRRSRARAGALEGRRSVP